MVPKGHQANLDTIRRAAGNGDLAVVEATQTGSDEPAYLLAAVGFDGETYIVTPLARMFDFNPYEQFMLAGALEDG